MVKKLKWFTDRIGKRVYRDPWFCKCKNCVDLEKQWIIIENEMHASYLFDVEQLYGCELIELNYRDEL
jgi:hypothetical protein